VFPVVPTTFNDAGELDLESQKRCVDFMIDAGSTGLCILANFSEQFVLADAEREVLTKTILAHVNGRVPVIVTTTHFSTQVTIARSVQAQQLGASMVMVMPPYHGATIRVPEGQIYEYFARLSDAIDIPIMIQDAPVSGTPLSVPFWRAWRRRSSRCRTSRSRQRARRPSCASSSAWVEPQLKARGMVKKPSPCMPDLDAGATGAMTGGAYPDGIRKIVDAYAAGRREEAAAHYQQWLPLINFENRQGGILTAKALMKEGGVIACEAGRHPFPAMHRDDTRRSDRHGQASGPHGVALGPVSPFITPIRIRHHVRKRRLPTPGSPLATGR